MNSAQPHLVSQECRRNRALVPARRCLPHPGGGTGVPAKGRITPSNFLGEILEEICLDEQN